jgi:hypothetical protein
MAFPTPKLFLTSTILSSTPRILPFLALDRVLEAYEKAGLKLQPAKCQLFQREIEYLGHMVSAKGIAPVPGYIQVVKDWPMPTNRSEVRTFLGIVASWKITPKWPAP